MTWAAIGATAASAAIGSKQTGGIAPAPQLGGLLGQAGGGNLQDELMKPQGLLALLQSMNQGPESPVSDAVGAVPALANPPMG